MTKKVNIKENNQLYSMQDCFYKALKKTTPEEAIDQLVESAANTLNCDRFYVFAKNRRGDYNYYREWCKDGITSEMDMLHEVPGDIVNNLLDDNPDIDALYIDDIEYIKEEYGFVYEILKARNVKTFIAIDIPFEQDVLGFLCVENTPQEILHSYEEDIAILSFILGQLMNALRLKDRLEKVGIQDKLTGVGNRQGVYLASEEHNLGEPIGILYGDALNLKEINNIEGESVGDDVLIQIAKVFSKEFGNNNVYRLGGDEFVVLVFGQKEEIFQKHINNVREIFKENNIDIALGDIYEENWSTSIDALLRKADLKVFDSKRTFYRSSGVATKDVDEEDAPIQTIELISVLDFDENSYRILYRYDNHFQYLANVGMLQETYQLIMKKYVHPDDQKHYNYFWDSNVKNIIKSQPNGELSIEYRIPNNEGSWEWVRETLSIIDIDEGDFKVISTIKNISILHQNLYQKGKEESISTDNMHIDLYSGQEVFSRADIWLQKINSYAVAMIAIDLNNFKLYNSIFGRKAGDKLLEMTAQMVKEAVHRFGGLAGYIGGDNFMLLIPSDDMTQEGIRSWIEEQIDDLHLANGFVPAFGVCVTNDKTVPSSVLYERALLIISSVKNNYTNHVAFFDESQYIRSQQDQLLLMDIEKAIREKEFIFYLQPKVDMRSKKIVGFEALVRWVKDNDIISPAVFVDLMEETGYIHALDIYIWEEVCKLQRQLIDNDIDPLPISFNVSRVDFHFGDVAKTVIDLVDKYDLPHELIQLEVTESAYAKDPDIIKRSVSELHSKGFTILMDDFGKGYSSLNSLRDMHVDVLKLDKKFIDGMDEEGADRDIVETVIRMAHLIGMVVVVEGVETDKQVNELTGMHCRYAQGFYFYRPMPVEDAISLMNEDNILRGTPTEETRRIEDVHFDELIDARLISVNQLNKMVGGLAIVKIGDNKSEIMQMNEECADFFGIPKDHKDYVIKGMEMLEERMDARLDVFVEADKHKLDGYTHIGIYPGSGEKEGSVAGTIFPLTSNDKEKLYLLWLREAITDASK